MRRYHDPRCPLTVWGGVTLKWSHEADDGGCVIARKQTIGWLYAGTEQVR